MFVFVVPIIFFFFYFYFDDSIFHSQTNGPLTNYITAIGSNTEATQPFVRASIRCVVIVVCSISQKWSKVKICYGYGWPCAIRIFTVLDGTFSYLLSVWDLSSICWFCIQIKWRRWIGNGKRVNNLIEIDFLIPRTMSQ